jgi:hypothetical protein
LIDNKTTQDGGGNTPFLVDMITTETPYKLSEIIRDTWPGLYRPPKVNYNNQKPSKNEKV